METIKSLSFCLFPDSDESAENARHDATWK